MHDSVMNFVHGWLHPQDVKDKRVLEVGSRNINGSVRPMIEKHGPEIYIGLDMIPGKSVDVVGDWTAGHFETAWQMGYKEKFDVVLCLEMLEHCLDWALAIDRMEGALVPGGVLMVTTRAPGFPKHEHPGDYWRFTIEDFRQIFGDMDIDLMGPDPQVPGVFLKARRPMDGRLLPANSALLKLYKVT